VGIHRQFLQLWLLFIDGNALRFLLHQIVTPLIDLRFEGSLCPQFLFLLLPIFLYNLIPAFTPPLLGLIVLLDTPHFAQSFPDLFLPLLNLPQLLLLLLFSQALPFSLPGIDLPLLFGQDSGIALFDRGVVWEYLM
jgi:hypothetical protein